MARLLVVDDEPLIALNTSEVLMDCDHSVVGPAYRLETALAFAREEALDGAILDIHLAGSQVWPVAQILAGRGIAFLLLSGLGSALEVPRAFSRAPRLTKPYSEAQLLSAVADMLRQGALAPMESD
jgi:CheY-like chemotaxis protein